MLDKVLEAAQQSYCYSVPSAAQVRYVLHPSFQRQLRPCYAPWFLAGCGSHGDVRRRRPWGMPEFYQLPNVPPSALQALVRSPTVAQAGARLRTGSAGGCCAWYRGVGMLGHHTKTHGPGQPPSEWMRYDHRCPVLRWDGIPIPFWCQVSCCWLERVAIARLLHKKPAPRRRRSQSDVFDSAAAWARLPIEVCCRPSDSPYSLSYAAGVWQLFSTKWLEKIEKPSPCALANGLWALSHNYWKHCFWNQTSLTFATLSTPKSPPLKVVCLALAWLGTDESNNYFMYLFSIRQFVQRY